jgi:hypothetical protein
MRRPAILLCLDMMSFNKIPGHRSPGLNLQSPCGAEI